jgi:hypothetical protein
VAVRSESTVPEVLVGEVVTEPVAVPRGGVPYGIHLVWKILGTFLFYTLRMLRPFLRIVMAIVSGLCVLVAITLMILGWLHGWSGSFLWGAGGFLLGAVVSSALTWYYDVLLLKLTPEGYQLTLWS